MQGFISRVAQVAKRLHSAHGTMLGILPLLTLGLAFTPADTAIYKYVTPAKNLQQVAKEIKESVDSANHIVQFSTYASVGTFRLEAPPTRIDTLFFERDPSKESDSALTVSGDTALIEIKSMKRGTVVLRGLAFNLASTGARVLAASEPGKENFNLVIDSCFFFGDNIASSYLAWLGSTGSRVEIRRSYFVFRTGTAKDTRISLSADNVLLNNNLFNFPGGIFATIGNVGAFDARSNTVNRTQFRLESAVPGAATYDFRQNFIGYKGPQDAFGGTDPYVLLASNFNASGSYVLNTRMFPGWKGFDHPLGQQRWAVGVENLVVDSSIKSSSELWDWYLQGPDSGSGMQSGILRRKEAYDVWPGQESHGFLFVGNVATAHFRHAPFPRLFKDSFITSVVPGVQPADIRVHSAIKGALHFGSFQMDSITIKMSTTFGRPILLAGDAANKFTPQRITGAYKTPPFGFPNDSLQARRYFIAFQGNTPRGENVIPGGISLGASDSLSFDRIDSAGYTLLKSKDLLPSAYPDSLRSLQISMSVITSAYSTSSVVFGSRDVQVKAWKPSQVHWWNPEGGNALLPATRSDDGKYFAKVPATDSFSVYLVERLNVKRGRVTEFPLADGGKARASSADGYHLAIDSSYRPNPLYFGKAVAGGKPATGYAFSHIGRGATDALVLTLPGGKDVGAFRVNKDGGIDSVSATDSAGFLSFQVVPADSNLHFFTGMRFNVIANMEFKENLEGVSISRLVSSTSGRISIHPFETALLTQGSAGDTVPSNIRVLGAKSIQTQFLDLAAGYSAVFTVVKPTAFDKVEAYAWNGQGWRLLNAPTISPDSTIAAVSGLLHGDKAFVVVERLLPAETYVTMNPTVGVRKITVTSKFNNGTYQPITSYSLIVQQADQFGDVKTIGKVDMPIGQTAIVDLQDKSGLFKYFIQYHTKEGPYGLLNPYPITTFSWQPEKIQIHPRTKSENRWHLVGYPYKSTFAATLTKVGEPPENIVNIRSVYKLKVQNGQAAWDSLRNEQALSLEPGDAFLLNSTVPHDHVVDVKGDFLTTPIHTLHSGGPAGWQFISTPYPMTFHASKVVSSTGTLPVFKELLVDSMMKDSKLVRTYRWEATSILKAFQGYAYQFQAGETLTFNPWSANSAAPPAKTASEDEPPAVRVLLKSEFAPRSMELRSGHNARSIGFLPAPGIGPELRLGGPSGFMVKKVDDLSNIDEPVSIRLPWAQKGGLALERMGDLKSIPDWQARLLDPATGQVYDLTASGDIQWQAGTREYRLVAGEGAFVRERIRAFQDGIPAGLDLSQNFPNPFRKTTSIALDWPSMAGHVSLEPISRKAWIEVFDARGRRVHLLDLGPVKAGRQVAVLDASGWEAGVYTYRLTLETAGKRVRMQKRMVVTP